MQNFKIKIKAEPFGFSDFHLYVCAAFLLRYSKNLIEEKDFQVKEIKYKTKRN